MKVWSTGWNQFPLPPSISFTVCPDSEGSIPTRSPGIPCCRIIQSPQRPKGDFSKRNSNYALFTCSDSVNWFLPLSVRPTVLTKAWGTRSDWLCPPGAFFGMLSNLLQDVSSARTCTLPWKRTRLLPVSGFSAYANPPSGTLHGQRPCDRLSLVTQVTLHMSFRQECLPPPTLPKGGSPCHCHITALCHLSLSEIAYLTGINSVNTNCNTTHSFKEENVPLLITTAENSRSEGMCFSAEQHPEHLWAWLLPSPRCLLPPSHPTPPSVSLPPCIWSFLSDHQSWQAEQIQLCWWGARLRQRTCPGRIRMRFCWDPAGQYSVPTRSLRRNSAQPPLSIHNNIQMPTLPPYLKHQL